MGQYYFMTVNGELCMSAMQLEDYLKRWGLFLPTDDKGHTHPGTIFNQVIGSLSLIDRKEFGIPSGGIMSVPVENNKAFTNTLLTYGVISTATIKENAFDLYSLAASQVVIRSLLRSANFRIEPREFEINHTNYSVLVAAKKIDKPKTSAPSLIGRAVVPKKYRVIDQFTPEEQDVIRRYQNLAKETRVDGSRKYRRKLSGRYLSSEG